MLAGISIGVLIVCVFVLFVMLCDAKGDISTLRRWHGYHDERLEKLETAEYRVVVVKREESK